MSRSGRDASIFPQAVAWASLGVAMLLFCGNTVPALRERKALRATAADLRQQLLAAQAELARALSGTPGAGAPDDDLQSVLVAIDRIGWTPAELLRAYPLLPDDAAGRPR